MLVSIGVIAEIFGVTAQTIRNWTEDGMFKITRTQGGHRRYSLDEIGELQGMEEKEKKTIIYARVSSHDQKKDLQRQIEELESYCKTQKIENIETLRDIGSGINYKKRGLKKLLKEIILGRVKRIVVAYSDRLLRFGSELIQQICNLRNIEIVTLYELSEKSFEESLSQDVITILTVFCAKIYGRRSHEKRKAKLASCKI